MLVLVTYDVNVVADGGRKRLRKIAEACLDHGIRVQNSVFECEVTPGEFALLKRKLTEIFAPESDSIRFYFLGAKGRQRVEHIGAKPTVDPLRDGIVLSVANRRLPWFPWEVSGKIIRCFRFTF